MTISSISMTIGHGIALGASDYGVTLTIGAAGAIERASYAVYGPTLAIDEAIFNHGDITAGQDGIFLKSPGTLVNTGSIYGGDFGAAVIGYHLANHNAGRKDYFQNTGRIGGGTIGVYLYNDAASLTTAGLVLGNARSTETIDLATVPVIADLSVSGSGGKATISFVLAPPIISTINSTVPGTLTLGENDIAISLTVENPATFTRFKPILPMAGQL